MKNLIFKYRMAIEGDLQTNLVFTDMEALNLWINTEFVIFKNNYENLSFSIYELDELKSGDACKVYVDGSDEFTIQ